MAESTGITQYVGANKAFAKAQEPLIRLVGFAIISDTLPQAAIADAEKGIAAMRAACKCTPGSPEALSLAESEAFVKAVRADNPAKR